MIDSTVVGGPPEDSSVSEGVPSLTTGGSEMEVEISQIAVYPTSLRLGMVIRYGKDGPVRFASAYVTDEVLSMEVVGEILTWCTRTMNRYLDTQREAEMDVDSPLF